MPELSPSLIQNLPKKILYRNIDLLSFSFENEMNEITVSPSTKVYGKLVFNLKSKGESQALSQILIGIKGLGAQAFILSERRIIGKRWEGLMGVDDQQRAYEKYTNYSKKFFLKAPLSPGLYEVQIGLMELPARPMEKPGVFGFFELSTSDKDLLCSDHALKTLWNLENKICKITMGQLRVI